MMAFGFYNLPFLAPLHARVANEAHLYAIMVCLFCQDSDRLAMRLTCYGTRGGADGKLDTEPVAR